MHDEIRQFERDFAGAIVRNDAEAIGRFLSDDWVIVDPDGGIIDRERFLNVIRSGALTHTAMDSDDVRVRVYGESAVITALMSTVGAFQGHEFTSRERATDFLVRQDGEWRCVATHLTRVAQRPAA
jgi:ketosteroid isomerase-like protein